MLEWLRKRGTVAQLDNKEILHHPDNKEILHSNVLACSELSPKEKVSGPSKNYNLPYSQLSLMLRKLTKGISQQKTEVCCKLFIVDKSLTSLDQKKSSLKGLNIFVHHISLKIDQRGGN